VPDIGQLQWADDVTHAVARWRNWLEFEKRASAHTVESYSLDVNNLFQFLNEHHAQQINLNMLSGLTLTDFRGWLARNASQKHQATSRARAVAGVRNFFRWMDRTGQLHNNAIELVKMPKSARRLPRPVTEIQAQEIVTLSGTDSKENWVGLRNKALFTLLYGAGLRISEALNLTQNDLIRNDRITVTGKGNKQRNVPLLPIVLAALEHYREACPYVQKPDDPLFVGERGQKLNPAVAQRHLRQLRRQLNLPESVTPHALRHSFATHLLVSGADLRSLQELLGHSSLSSTQLYTQIDAQRLVNAYKASHPRAR
jgi:integrase/recombinase XerC